MAKLDYRNSKRILAPMVRVGTLPFRLLALEYGADIVYSEEIVDFKMDHCELIRNDELDTVDFGVPGGLPVFQTNATEKDRVVFQMGTSDPERALRVARLVEPYVAAVDVNMGCPKPFSVQAGMGAALLQTPDLARNILETLVKNLSIPVTCKVRVFEKEDATLEFCKMVERAGVAAVAIHGRRRDERPTDANRTAELARVAGRLALPVIANGGSAEMRVRDDIDAFGAAAGCDSVMVARAAMRNASVFSPDEPQPVDDVITRYLQLCADLDAHWGFVKYTMQRMLGEAQSTTARGRAVVAADSLASICAAWHMTDYYESRAARRKARPAAVVDTDVESMPVPFSGKRLCRWRLPPKVALHDWSVRNRAAKPTYNLVSDGASKRFKAIVEVSGRQFSSNNWESNKRFAEQSAAFVAGCALKLKTCVEHLHEN